MLFVGSFTHAAVLLVRFGDFEKRDFAEQPANRVHRENVGPLSVTLDNDQGREQHRNENQADSPLTDMDRNPASFAEALASGDADRVNDAIDEIEAVDSTVRVEQYTTLFDACDPIYQSDGG